jgi:hypothetical protein
LNRKWGRSGGGFFPRRASAEPILDEDALLARVLYVLMNPVASDLVEQVLEWPGLSSAPELLRNTKRAYRIFRRRAWHLAGRPKNKKKFIREVEFKHAVLPTFAKVTPEERAAKLSELVSAKEREHATRRASDGKGVLGRNRVLAANWFDRPVQTDRSPRPLCHASTPEARYSYRDHYRNFVADYRAASKRYRDGDYAVEFPPGSFPPPILRAAKPRQTALSAPLASTG